VTFRPIDRQTTYLFAGGLATGRSPGAIYRRSHRQAGSGPDDSGLSGPRRQRRLPSSLAVGPARLWLRHQRAASASRHSALSHGHIEKLETQIKAEVQELLALAEEADQADIPIKGVGFELLLCIKNISALTHLLRTSKEVFFALMTHGQHGHGLAILDFK